MILNISKKAVKNFTAFLLPEKFINFLKYTLQMI